MSGTRNKFAKKINIERGLTQYIKNKKIKMGLRLYIKKWAGLGSAHG